MTKPIPLPRPETCMFYSNSGVGKTTLIYFLALWMYETYGLTTRVISNDIGGWGPVEREGLMKAGIVNAFNVSSRPNLLADMRKLLRGHWPKILEEEQDGHDGMPRKVKVRRIVEDKAALEKVGLYFIEGATSTSTAFMRHISQQEEKIGPQDVSGRYTEDGESFGGNSEGHYNIVQTEMHGLFAQASSLPSPVRLVCWTGHVGKGKLKRTGESCYAPQLAGEAKNAEVPGWVGDCFHLEEIPEEVDEVGMVVRAKQVKAHYVSYPDAETGVHYICKSRVGPSDVEALRDRFPHGCLELGLERGTNIDQYFQWLEERQDVNLKKVMEWKKGMDARS